MAAQSRNSTNSPEANPSRNEQDQPESLAQLQRAIEERSQSLAQAAATSLSVVADMLSGKYSIKEAQTVVSALKVSVKTAELRLRYGQKADDINLLSIPNID